MYVYIHIYIHIYMYVLYIDRYICMYIYTSIDIYVCLYIHIALQGRSGSGDASCWRAPARGGGGPCVERVRGCRCTLGEGRMCVERVCVDVGCAGRRCLVTPPPSVGGACVGVAAGGWCGWRQ